MATLFALTAIVWLTDRAWIYQQAKRVLPDVIEVSGLHAFDMGPSQIACNLRALMLRCESAGAAVPRLSDDAARKIEREGLGFFAGNTRSTRIEYDEWRASPLPEEWGETETLSGLWHGVAHISIGSGMRNRLNAAWDKGAYYTRRCNGGGSWLAVIPSERLVVYSWSE